MRSSDINEYLQDALGDGFSAKDFRTWTATVLAAVGLAAEEQSASERQRRAAVVRVVRSVAHQLGNTPAVARGSYVDPRIIERYEHGHTVGDGSNGPDVETMAARVLGIRDAAGTGDPAEGGGNEDTVSVEVVPPELLAEIDAAVIDLVERSPRRCVRARRPR